MRPLLLLLLFSFSTTYSFTQARDSASIARRDSILMARFLESATYPLIREATMGGVIPISNPEELPDKNMEYKLLMNFTQPAVKPDQAKAINHALAEVARIINLHIAAGIPKEKLKVMVVAHASGLFSLLDDEHYQKKFHISNPNSKLVNELMAAGVQFSSCGQAMKFLEIREGTLLPGVKLAYSAKTVISTYGLKGYVYMDVND